MTPLQREALQMCLEYIETDAHERRHVRWKINEALAEPQQEPTCKPYLQVWVQRTGQFSWEPQDERFWTRLTTPQPPAQPQQEPVAWMSNHAVGFRKSEFGATPTVPLYTSPQPAAELRRLHAIEEAARNLVKVKGRFHTEQAFNKLKELLS